MKHIAIFASGNGSNAENIIKYFKSHKYFRVVLVFSNNSGAGVLKRAANHNIETYVFDNSQLISKEITNQLKKLYIDMIVLSGFLLKIPINIIKAYPNKIINIHPSLLPLYGGKGMYGRHVHDAVCSSNDNFTGITIHFVNADYDMGDIIFQAKTRLPDKRTVKLVEKKVRKLELKFFPIIIENLLNEYN